VRAQAASEHARAAREKAASHYTIGVEEEGEEGEEEEEQEEPEPAMARGWWPRSQAGAFGAAGLRSAIDLTMLSNCRTGLFGLACRCSLTCHIHGVVDLTMGGPSRRSQWPLGCSPALGCMGRMRIQIYPHTPVVAYGTVPGQQYDTPTVGPIVGTTGYMLCDTDLS
jgi:hypothetical protein